MKTSTRTLERFAQATGTKLRILFELVRALAERPPHRSGSVKGVKFS